MEPIFWAMQRAREIMFGMVGSDLNDAWRKRQREVSQEAAFQHWATREAECKVLPIVHPHYRRFTVKPRLRYEG